MLAVEKRITSPLLVCKLSLYMTSLYLPITFLLLKVFMAISLKFKPKLLGHLSSEGKLHSYEVVSNVYNSISYFLEVELLETLCPSTLGTFYVRRLQAVSIMLLRIMLILGAIRPLKGLY